jgi:hypothetical protein
MIVLELRGLGGSHLALLPVATTTFGSVRTHPGSSRPRLVGTGGCDAGV